MVMVRMDAHDRRPYKYLLELLGRSALCLRTFRIAFADAHVVSVQVSLGYSPLLLTFASQLER